MRSIDTIRLASRVLRHNLLRTILTTGGIGVATGSIIFLISLGLGLQDLTIGSVARSNTILTMDVFPTKNNFKDLTDEEIANIQTIRNVEIVARSMPFRGQIDSHQLKNIDATVVAIDRQYLDLEAVDYLAGQNFDQLGIVVSESLAKVLGLKPNQLIGQKMGLTILSSENDYQTTQEYPIAGVTKSLLSTETVVIHAPLNELDLEKFKISSYPKVKVKVSNLASVDQVRQDIASLGFSVKAIVDTVAQIQRAFKIFQVVLVAIGAIAMVVASIGMFNTLTISLLERTKEVGIMRALGASKKNIFYLFLAEAIILGFLGGLLAWLIAWLGQGLTNSVLSLLASALDGKRVSVFANPPLLYLGMVVFSTGLAWLTGFYPAKRAARLNPIDAIRYE